MSPLGTSCTASAGSCISGTSSSTSVIRSVDASAIMIITNTKVTIIRDMRMDRAYTITLVSSPTAMLPRTMLSPPTSTMIRITEYRVNCMVGEFQATIFSALVNKVYTTLEMPWNFRISKSSRT